MDYTKTQGLDAGWNMITEKDRVIYLYEDDKDKIRVTVYQIYEGIELIYYDVHAQNRDFEVIKKENIIEINYCREGRVEFEYGNKMCHISSGDIAILDSSKLNHEFYYPFSHYHGLSLSIDLKQAPETLSKILRDVNVAPALLKEKFCADEGCFIARSSDTNRKMFSDLYDIPESIRIGYLKVKSLEVFLYLSVLSKDEDEHIQRSCSPQQALLARSISRYLMDHKNDRITLEELSKEFHASGTNIKSSFKAVYGVSVYSYVRAQKMESAAYMLENTDKSILEIAGEHGYDNASKFAGAFRTVKGIAPNEYRNESRRINRKLNV